MTSEEPAGGERTTVGRLVFSGNLDFERVVFFSDAVFAIAITLLVVDLPVKVASGTAVESGHELRTAVPDIESFLISFAVIGLFWIGHHSIFRYVTAFNRQLILLNLLFLGTIAFLPYPTQVLGTTSDQAPAVIFYAACCSAAGIAEGAVWLYATRPGSGLAGLATPRVRRSTLLQIGRIPLIFLLSIPVALVSPTWATLTWILILVLSLMLRRIAPADELHEVAD